MAPLGHRAAPGHCGPGGGGRDPAAERRPGRPPGGGSPLAPAEVPLQVETGTATSGFECGPGKHPNCASPNAAGRTGLLKKPIHY